MITQINRNKLINGLKYRPTIKSKPRTVAVDLNSLLPKHIVEELNAKGYANDDFDYVQEGLTINVTFKQQK